MSKIKTLIFGAFLLLLHNPLPGLAQKIAVEPDSAAAFKNTVALYREKVKSNSALYDGREFVPYSNRIQGHAFFESNEWQNAELQYKGQRYYNVPMLYDLVLGEVVIQHPDGILKIKLASHEVGYFSLLNHHFVRLEQASPSSATINSGFYDLLYNGQVRVLASHKKEIWESFVDMALHREFIQQKQLFLEKEGNYYRINRKSSALKVLKDHKKELRRFLRKNNIIFSRNPEFALMRMAAFYDQITLQP